MEGAGFKSLIIFFLLAILAFIAGSLASENIQNAAIPIALVVGVFFLLYLGKNSWILLFIFPPIFDVIGLSLTKEFPIVYLLSGIIMFYMIALSMLGYLKIKWQSLPALDILTLLVCGYTMVTWVRNPVTINAFTSITDFGYQKVGGAIYIWCIAAMIYYVAVGITNVKLETLIKTLKWAFILTLIASVFACAKALITGDVQVGDEIATSRVSSFTIIAQPVFFFLTAKYSIIGILMSPWKLILIIAALIGGAVSGFRSFILTLAIYFVIVSTLHKKLLFLLMMAFLAWGSIVYISHEQDIDDLPFGIQRVLSSVPGVKLRSNNAAAREAEHSLEWRIEMWEWALNPSKGYIKNYVWGDGVEISQIKLKQERIAIALGLIDWGSNKNFAAKAEWHSTIISLIHAFGYVGFSIILVWLLYLSYIVLRVCIALKSVRGKEYVYVLIIPFLCFMIALPTRATAPLVIFQHFSVAALAKLLYLLLRQNGYLAPVFKRNNYVPNMIKHESDYAANHDAIKA